MNHFKLLKGKNLKFLAIRTGKTGNFLPRFDLCDLLSADGYFLS
jgi:hypothetical protein